MAHVYIRLNEEELDYYVVWDTYYELPYTIPMDLASFVLYLYEEDYSFSGLIASWSNLINSCISLDNTKIETYLKAYQISFLKNQIAVTYIKEKSIQNINLSNSISVELGVLSNKYSILLHTKDESDLILNVLNEEFKLFVNCNVKYKLSILPIHSYRNIEELYGKFYDKIPTNKLSDFYEFLHKNIYKENEVNWYLKEFFLKDLYWHQLPIFIRENCKITNLKAAYSENMLNPFIRNIKNVSTIEYKPTVLDLMSYYNHLINENLFIVTEVIDNLIDKGIEIKNNLIAHEQIEYLYNNYLLDEELNISSKFVNFVDKEGNKLLPDIYTEMFFTNGLYVFYKYDIQLLDVFNINGDLLFMNLENIDVFEKNNETYVSYIIEEKSKQYYKKLIIENDQTIQLLDVLPEDFL
jgi:hypothetical protein